MPLSGNQKDFAAEAQEREVSLAFWMFFTALVALAFYFGHSQFLLFHLAAELFTTIIASATFLIAWNARPFIRDRYLLFLGIAYLFVGLLDVFHALVYKGMPFFSFNDANPATQLWICARGLESVSILAAVSLKERFNERWILGGFALLTAFLVSTVAFGVFPDCFVEGSGLTPFKIVSEYVICAILAASLIIYGSRRQQFDPVIFRWVVASIGVMIFSELCFTLYQTPFDVWNITGHVLKAVSFYFMYRAMIVTALAKPYALFFKDLKETEEGLRRINAELDGYARMVAHDIKGPLTSISLGSEIILRTLNEPAPELRLDRVKKLAESIGHGAKSATEFVNDVLALAQAGQAPREVKKVEVSEVIEQILKERATSLESKKIKVDWKRAKGAIVAAPTHIYQILTNLIDNASRYANPSDPKIAITYSITPKTGEHVILVRDNGPGVAPETADKIFLPFFKEKSPGHGLGLATVHKITRLYGGTVTVTNDDGACFRVVLKDFMTPAR